ncbi:MAG: LD-carboxypeptidase [Candidatus Hinthialibacter antarcticus]|nr:LD-carboxypeptidase [Candidatus Hinthialibacter antarcticus]
MSRTAPVSPLQSGDWIGFAAPAHAVSNERIQRAANFFEENGYRVRVALNASDEAEDKILGKLAGPDAARIASTNAMFAAPDIKAICCLTGGYGVTRILRDLNFSALKKHPKVICGFSDITALHLGVYRETGLISYHSPNVDSYPLDAATESVWLRMLRGETVNFDEKVSAQFKSNAPTPQTWRAGKAKGVLIGGNLSLVAALAGTPWGVPRDRDVILFLEDVGEFAYRIDVMLLQLMQSGAFNRVKGLILGQFSKRKVQQNETPDLLERVLKAFCAQLDIPIVMNFPIGHVRKNFTVAHGARVELNTEDVSLRYLDPIYS